MDSTNPTHPGQLTLRMDAEERARAKMISITPLSYIPGKVICRYLGQINLHFIREEFDIKYSGGLGSFYHNVINQAQAVCRANVVAQGGNALTSFRIKPHESGGKMFRNQAYSLLSVTGDVVEVV